MRTLPRLESERLVLSVAGRDDYIRLRDLVADPQVQRYLGPPPENPTADMFARALRAAGSWHLYGYGMFLIWEKAGGAFVGQAGVFHTLRGFGKGLDDVPEAGWMLAQRFWGKGYAGCDGLARHFQKRHGLLLQIINCERLGQHCNISFGGILLQNDAVSIAGHEQNFEAGLTPSRFISHLSAIQAAGQADIGDEQIDLGVPI